jgi:hypothetical protein
VEWKIGFFGGHLLTPDFSQANSWKRLVSQNWGGCMGICFDSMNSGGGGRCYFVSNGSK